ncbi:amino acid adenylation domain-containing protein [Tateyamaria sp. SN3-11]|uniref:amino acid adenylation domain-containing protein n=1 Tax=Tateyamaria sp. SN3-11 TaxID=3092147 RepID=UPI0039EA865E
MDPTPGLNALGVWVTFHTPVPHAALGTALAKVIARHEALRTRYLDRDGDLDLRIEDDVAIPFGAPLSDTSPDALAQALGDMHLKMDMPTPWHMRPAPIDPAHPDGLVSGVLIGAHHAVMDWTGLGVLVHDLDQALGPDKGQLTAPSMQAQDHAQTARKALDTTRMAAQAYWQERLADCPAELALPAAHGAPLSGYDSQQIRLSAAQSHHLRARASELGTTPFVLLLSAYGLLLAGLSGTSDVVVGTAVSHRDQAGSDAVLGCLSDLIPLRLDMDGAANVDTALTRTRDLLARDVAHAAVGFSDIVAASGVARRKDKAPLVQAIFNALPAMPAAQHLTARPVHGPIARADIALEAVEQDSITLRLELRDGLFAPAMRTHIAQCLTRAITHVLNDGAKPFGTVDWPLPDRDTQAPMTSNATHLGTWLFERMAQRQTTAIRTDRGDISFAALCDRAEGLAAALLAQGVQSGDAVAIQLPRGMDQVVSVLACLRAGGVLVLLDPDHPFERRRDILAQSQATLLVTDDTDERLACVVQARIDPTPARDIPRPAHWPDRDPQDLAYIVFTSGSTGRPKGACGTHQGLINRLLWMEAAYPWARDEVACFKTSPAFVDALTEMLGPLAAGVPSVIAGADVARDPAALARFMAEHQVTRIVAVPSLISVWLDHVPSISDLLSRLRLCVASGEALPPRVVDKMSEKLPACQLLNLYGASEISGDVTHHLAEPGQKVTPIGRPLPGNAVAIEDAEGRALPCGFPGELVVSGVGLAAGYRGARSQDAQRFRNMAAFEGARGYATGDFAYIDHNGDVVLLGRRDDQVKIDGVRVELGDVARVLESAPGVAQCVVVATSNADNRTQLIAFLTRTASGIADESAWRSYARARLLGSAVPGRFLVLDSMPVGPTGKIDRKALQAQAMDWQEPPDQGDVAHTAMSQRIGEIWAEVLNVPVPSPHADFFALGGTSLRAIVILSRLATAFGRYFEPGMIFDAPQLGDLAATIDLELSTTPDGADRTSAAQLPIPMAHDHGQSSLLTANQAWLWRVHRDKPDSTAYNLVAAYTLDARVDTTSLARAVTGVFARHTSLRTQVRPKGGAVSMCLMDVPDASEALTWHDDRTTPADQLMQQAAARPFMLAQENPARFLIYPRDTGVLLIVSVHHMASDGWSAQVILDDLARLYDHYVHAGPELAGPGLQTADVAVWQGETRPMLQDRLASYVERIAGAAGPQLPSSMLGSPRGGAALRCDVDVDPVALDTIVRAAPPGTTTLGAICAAWALTLRGFGTDGPLLIGLPRAGRGAPGLERTVGFLANTVLMALDPDPVETWADTLAQTQQAVRDTGPFDMIPLDWVQDQGAGWRADQSEIRTMVVPEDGFDWRLSLSGVDVAWVGQSQPTQARVDLALVLSKTATGQKLEMEYDTGRIPSSLARALCGALRTILNHAAADPQARGLPLVDAATLPGLLRSAAAHCPDATGRLDEVLAAWARAAPDALAAQDGTDAVTTRQLEDRVMDMAQRLRAAGVTPAMAVGIACERGVPWFVGILAVWRVGASVVILDPSWPSARRADTCADAQVAVVLDAAMLTTSTPLPPILAEATDAHDVPAALTYTSGTTGTPKGVALRHDALIRLGHALAQRLDVRAGDRVLQAAAPAFDVALSDIAMALVAQATLVVLPQNEVMAGRSLTHALRHQRITHMQVAASVLSNTGAADLPDLRCVAVGGELCPRTTLDAWERNRTLYVAYGPAEATVTVSLAHYSPDTVLGAIGQPIAGNCIAVLDRFDQPLPPGAVGDVVIAGPQVAHYVGGAAAQAHGFGVTDVFGSDMPSLRTGDRGWVTDAGCLVFAGRNDRQIKIRGTRVEPLAVEQLLESHPDVTQAVVGPSGDGPDRRLVAWVIRQADPSDDSTETALRCWLAGRLAKAWVPSHIAVVNSWPLTPNGKLDKSALPTPWDDPVGGPSAPASDVPQTQSEVERLLSRLWRELLRRQDIPRDRSFYECGGDSLLIVTLQTRLETTLLVDIPVGELFANPTLPDMAAMIFSKLPRKTLVEYEI